MPYSEPWQIDYLEIFNQENFDNFLTNIHNRFLKAKFFFVFFQLQILSNLAHRALKRKSKNEKFNIFFNIFITEGLFLNFLFMLISFTILFYFICLFLFFCHSFDFHLRRTSKNCLPWNVICARIESWKTEIENWRTKIES